MIHFSVDFDEILQQTRLQENSFGKALRLIEYRWGKRPKPATRIRVVEVQPHRNYLAKNFLATRGHSRFLLGVNLTPVAFAPSSIL